MNAKLQQLLYHIVLWIISNLEEMLRDGLQSSSKRPEGRSDVNT